MMDAVDFESLVARFTNDSILAIGLTGSYARGDAGPRSDVDLLRLSNRDQYDESGNGSHWIEERLVNVSTLTPSEIEATFSDPDQATTLVAGLRAVRILMDADDHLARLQMRAEQFEWNEQLQQRANDWASKAMVGWAEEVYKGLEGLRRDDPARLIQARFGCTWGLTSVIRVQRGILMSSDNDMFGGIDGVMVGEPQWVRLRHQAFGLQVDGVTPSLRQQVEAGLRLYVVTAALVAHALRPQDRELIMAAVDHIRRVLVREPT